MGETAGQQTPPPPVVAPPPSYALSKGPTWAPAEQLQQLQYCIHSNPSWPESCLLAFQHFIVMLGTTVLIASQIVPQMGGTFGDKAQVIQTFATISCLQRFVHTMRTLQGSMIVCSFLNIILGYSQAWGRLTRYFSPIIMVPTVTVVGLGLFMRGFPQLARCVEIGLPMLILLVICLDGNIQILLSVG